MQRPAPRPAAPARPHAFGTALGDLDVDFDARERPRLVSQVLAAALDVRSDPGSAEAVDRWTLPRRLQALLRLALDSGETRLELRARCGDESCRSVIEVRVELAAFEQEVDERDIETRIGAETLTLRLPNGEDQLRWLEQESPADALALATDLVREVNGATPAAGWRVPAEWLDRLATRMEERDRLTGLRLDTACPECSRALMLEVDLEEQLLALLARCQRRALDAIHRLARAYHWSEEQILALSAARRAYYLARLDEDASA